MESAVVLLSGGLDSAVAAACARRDGFSLRALTVDYGQRHRVELDAAARVAASLGVIDHRVVSANLRAIGGSALTDEIDVPKVAPVAPASSRCSSGHRLEAGATAIPITYVPARNLTFLSLAAGYAETCGCRDLYLGVNAVDYSGYPDCRPEFIAAFERAVNLGTKAGIEGRPLRVRAPLSGLGKAEIIRLGVSLGVDFALTHSCYDPDAVGRACGRCDSCLIRRRGFEEAGVADPTVYEDARTEG